MFNLIWADLFKLRKSMAIKILFGITTVSAVTMTVISYLIQQGKLNGSMTGIGFLFADMNMMSILGAVMAGVSICGDFDNKTIHDAIANGCSRGVVIVSKAIVFFCAIVVLLSPYVLITSVALGTGAKFSIGSVAIGFLNLLTSEAGAAFSAAEILKLLAVIMTLILVYVAQLSVCVPIAFVLKKPVFVVAIYYGLTILCAQFLGLKGSSPVFDSIFACTPFGGNYSFINLHTGTGDIFKAIFVCFMFIIIMLAVTYFTFRKSEVK